MNNPNEMRVPLEGDAATTALLYPSADPGVGATYILAHGAGAGQRSQFIVDFGRALSALGLDVVTFNFPFTQGSRDAFGTPDELAPIVATLHPTPTLHVVANGDHSFTVPRRNPIEQAAVFVDVQRTIVDWIRGLKPAARGLRPEA